jgi:hypothetical protein
MIIHHSIVQPSHHFIAKPSCFIDHNLNHLICPNFVPNLQIPKPRKLRKNHAKVSKQIPLEFTTVQFFISFGFSSSQMMIKDERKFIFMGEHSQLVNASFAQNQNFYGFSTV